MFFDWKTRAGFLFTALIAIAVALSMLLGLLFVSWFGDNLLLSDVLSLLLAYGAVLVAIDIVGFLRLSDFSDYGRMGHYVHSRLHPTAHDRAEV